MSNSEQLELFDPFEDLGDVTMGKVISGGDKGITFAKGGSGKMFGKGKAGKSQSGQSGKPSNAPPGGDAKWPEGGSGKMFGKQSAGTKVPGVSGKQSQSG